MKADPRSLFRKHAHGHPENGPCAQSIPDADALPTEESFDEEISPRINPCPPSQEDYSKEIPAGPAEEILENWKCVVDTIDEDSGIFTAVMYDLMTRETCPSQVAEIPIQNIDRDDRALILEGAVFYLTIGRSVVKGGRCRFEHLTFRRQRPWVWTEEDILRAQERANRIKKFLGLES